MPSEPAALAQRLSGARCDRFCLPASWAMTNASELVGHGFKEALCTINDVATACLTRDVRRYHATAEQVIRGAGNAGGRGRTNRGGAIHPEYRPHPDAEHRRRRARVRAIGRCPIHVRLVT